MGLCSRRVQMCRDEICKTEVMQIKRRCKGRKNERGK